MQRMQIERRDDLAEAEGLIATGKPREAMNLLLARLQQDPADPDASALLCRLAMSLGDADLQERTLAAALRHDPSLLKEVIAFTTKLFEEGRIHECALVLARLLQAEPGCAEAWNDLGAARFALGEPEGAEHCFRRALDLSPGYELALTNLKALYLFQNRIEEAARIVLAGD